MPTFSGLGWCFECSWVLLGSPTHPSHTHPAVTEVGSRVTEYSGCKEWGSSTPPEVSLGWMSGPAASWEAGGRQRKGVKDLKEGGRPEAPQRWQEWEDLAPLSPTPSQQGTSTLQNQALPPLSSHHPNLLLEYSLPRNMPFKASSSPSTPPSLCPSFQSAVAAFQSHLPWPIPESTLPSVSGEPHTTVFSCNLLSLLVTYLHQGLCNTTVFRTLPNLEPSLGGSLISHLGFSSLRAHPSTDRWKFDSSV